MNNNGLITIIPFLGCGLLKLLVGFFSWKIFNFLILNRRLFKLKMNIHRYQKRYDTLRKKATDHIHLMNKRAVKNLDSAGEKLGSATNLLILAEQFYERDEMHNIKRLLDYKFLPGEISGRRYDGTLFLLPNSELWMPQLEELLKSVDREIALSIQTQRKNTSILRVSRQ